MDYKKLRKADLLYLLEQNEERVKNLQEKLIAARNCAECLYCENRKCKNHQFHMLEEE